MSGITHNPATGSFSLSPVKPRGHMLSASMEESPKTRLSSPYRYSSQPLTSPLLSSKLMESKSHKKRLEKEQQILLNRVKYLEEEEMKAKMRLAKALTEHERHVQSKQLRESFERAKKRREEMEEAHRDHVRNLSETEKERRKIVRDKMTSHHIKRNKDMEEIRQKKQYFKQLSEQVKEQLKTSNIERADSTRKQRQEARLENERAKEKLKKMKLEERRTNRRQNEQQYHEMKDNEVKSKSEVVKYIKDSRMTFERTHNHLRQLSHEKVASAIQAQMLQEEQQAKHIAQMIEYLREQELEAKRRLENTKRTLEKIGSDLVNISPTVYDSLSPKKSNPESTFSNE